MVDFYHHEQNWSNRMILGDSLLVMTSLAEKEGLKGKVQMIYFDPPYGISFGSNWQVSTRKRDVRDGSARDLSRQPEQIKAFRDTWQLGIHSYLTFLRDRLSAARELLTESGSIFVQIGDENVHLARCLLDEVFGRENFISEINFSKTSGFSGSLLSNVSDYLVWYAKSIANVKYRQLYLEKEIGGSGASKYRTQHHELSDGRPATSADLTSQGAPAGGNASFSFQGEHFTPASHLHWKTTITGMMRLAKADRIRREGRFVRYVRYLDDFPVYPISNSWTDTGSVQSRTDPKVYVVQTSTSVVQRCILMTTDPGDLVLDPTCGSGTTAYVAEQWARRWITIDTSRVALALARTRLMSARYPYFFLADTPEGQTKEREVTGNAAIGELSVTGDVRKGFVYRRVPHIMLSSIANNAEIDVIYDQWQTQLEPLRERINRALGTTWEEWEVPRSLDDAGVEATPEVAKLLEEWWELRRKRQEEIDASIARHSESEILYDQPYEDPRKIRVSGPFTVESLSPHRVLSTDDERPRSEAEGKRDADSQGGGFVPMILDNLRKAGVQNTVREERLEFDRIDLYPGEWIQAAGEYTDRFEQTQRVAVAIGPEHGTVGPETVKEAAKEAMRGAGFDLLLVCGFAFDAHANETAKEFRPEPNGKSRGQFVSEETRQYGKLPVELVRMNPDLAMGQELLKTTGAGNLFMIFGEPDIEIHEQPDGRLVVDVRGVDVYDPTTGQIRSDSPDEIACWFIDTDYNEESFFVRHAYFTGADQPYERLKRALRAEIDEDAWAQLYSATSRPFERPSTGKIAVKVINHYGDEVMKVYQV